MSVVLEAGTVTQSLWSRKNSETPLQVDGQCLHLSTGGSSLQFSSLAFNPLNELQAVVGTNEGLLFGVALKENKVFLLHHVPHRSFTHLAFFPLGLESAIVIYVTDTNEIGFVDWRTGRGVQDPVPTHTTHARPILGVEVESSPTPSVFFCLSPDLLTYWVKKEASDLGAYFICIAATSPCQCTVPLKLRASNAELSVPHRFTCATFFAKEKDSIFTCENNGVIARWTREEDSCQTVGNGVLGSVLQNFSLQGCRTTLSYKVSCCDTADGFIVVGSAESPPSLAFLKSDTLDGISQVRLPLEKGSASVTSVRILQEELVVCALTDGRAIAIAARNFQISFVIQKPMSPEKRISAPKSWRFEVMGPAFGAFWSSGEVYWYYLPSARVFYRNRCLRVNHNKTLNGIPAVEGHFTTSKVAMFLRKQLTRDGTVSNPVVTASKAQMLLQTRFPRKPLHLEKKHCEKWVNVNYVEEKSRKKKNPQNEERNLSEVLSNASYSDTLSDTSCAYNMGKLREHLIQYGVFPAEYRPAVWRFVLGLPNPSKTSSQFASLARFEKHIAVDIALSSLSLPPGKTRTRMEQALSVLAHHSPVLAMGDFIPFLVYPLTQIFQDDVQSMVEFVLVFFSNHGKEFFLCYPRAPTPVMLYLDYLLKKLCPSLFDHLERIGASSDVWGWEVMKSFYTDLLNAAEWLQVMDHAVLMHPKWLFIFHVYYVIALKEPLLKCLNFQEVNRVLQQPHTEKVPLVPVLLSAHQYFKTSSKSHSSEDGNMLSSYDTFRSLLPTAFEYPTYFEHDEAVVHERMRQLDAAEMERDAQRHKEEQLASLKQEIAEKTVRNELILQQQRARVAAKLEASAQSWLAYTELEAKRQKREEAEQALRREALRTHSEQAASIEQLADDLACVEQQTAHFAVDQFNEQTRWELTSRQADTELQRLEQQSRQRITEAVFDLVDKKEFDPRELRISVPVSAPPPETLSTSQNRRQTGTPPPPTAAAAGSAGNMSTGNYYYDPSRFANRKPQDDSHTDSEEENDDDYFSHAKNGDSEGSPALRSQNSTQRGGVGNDTSRELDDFGAEEDEEEEGGDDLDGDPSQVDELSSINSELQQFSSPQMFPDSMPYSSAIPRPPSQPNSGSRGFPGAQQVYQRMQEAAIASSSAASLPSAHGVRSSPNSLASRSNPNPPAAVGEPTHHTFAENRPFSPYPSSHLYSGTNSTTIPTSYLYSSPSFMGAGTATTVDQGKTRSSTPSR